MLVVPTRCGRRTLEPISEGHKADHHRGVFNAFQKGPNALKALRHAFKFTLEPGNYARYPQHLRRYFAQFLAQAQALLQPSMQSLVVLELLPVKQGSSGKPDCSQCRGCILAVQHGPLQPVLSVTNVAVGNPKIRERRCYS